MRKLMFSLVATLAFGSFAMANNVELLPVEEVESVSSKASIISNKIENIKLSDHSCCTIWQAAYDRAIDFGHNPTSAGNIAQAAYHACLKAEK